MLLTSCATSGVVDALAQRLGEQAHGVQRLAQVVAGGGEELRLRAVGHLGLAARGFGSLLLDAQLRQQVVGPQLQLDHAAAAPGGSCAPAAWSAR